MAALVRFLSTASSAAIGVETLKTIGMLCGAGLFVLLLFATYGLDLSPVVWSKNYAPIDYDKRRSF